MNLAGGLDLVAVDPVALKTRWVDLAMAGVLALSFITGIVRGLTFEVLSLAGWLAAYLAAQWTAPVLAPHLPVGRPGSSINELAGFVGAFIAALLLWAIVTRLIRLLVRASPLNALDRLFGAAFGVLRGVFVLLVAATVVGLTPARHSVAWQASKGALWLNDGLQAARPLLPAEVSRHLPG